MHDVDVILPLVTYRVDFWFFQVSFLFSSASGCFDISSCLQENVSYNQVLSASVNL